MKLSDKWTVTPNFTISNNKNVDFVSNVDGNLTNLGNTDIAFSPEFIAGNILTFSPLAPLRLSLMSKFVSSQYMDNIELPAAKLADYFVNDFNVTYTIFPKSVFKSVVISVLANNITNKQYISNGYMWEVYPYYYPQAGANFLAGLTLKF